MSGWITHSKLLWFCSRPPIDCCLYIQIKLKTSDRLFPPPDWLAVLKETAAVAYVGIMLFSGLKQQLTVTNNHSVAGKVCKLTVHLETLEWKQKNIYFCYDPVSCVCIRDAWKQRPEPAEPIYSHSNGCLLFSWQKWRRCRKSGFEGRCIYLPRETGTLHTNCVMNAVEIQTDTGATC